MPDDLFAAIAWDDNGLIPAIAQDATSKEILMVAWMNRTSLEKTLATGEAVYFSRSRQKLWHKGEESGNTQRVAGVYLDCDGDVLLLQVEQAGGIACHTGRANCFFRKLENGAWKTIAPVLKDPFEMYKKS
jgi:phosphoribosyl-AMP cyclohydrolase